MDKTSSKAASLRDTSRLEVLKLDPHIEYLTLPAGVRQTPETPRWRIVLESTYNTQHRIGVDIVGDVVLGRGREPDLIDLTPFGANDHGVSRRHALLRPSSDNLLLVDLNSTNGTLRSGLRVGPDKPYALRSGEAISLGTMEMRIQIIERPGAAIRGGYTDLAGAITATAAAITSQLDIEEVLDRVVESAISMTVADQTAIWLVGEHSTSLALEAHRGFSESDAANMDLSITKSLAGDVIRTGKPVRSAVTKQDESVKVQTNFLVKSVLLLPIQMAGITYGVLGAFRREHIEPFSDADQRALQAIADFAAIAVQNARLYAATDQELTRRVQEISAINALTLAIASTLDLNEIYRVLKAQLSTHWQSDTVLLWIVDNPESKPRIFPAEPQQAARDSLEKYWVDVAGAAERCALKREPVLLELGEVKRNEGDGRQPGTDRLDGESMVCLPLTVGGHVVGVLAALRGRDNPFRQSDLDYLTSYANPIAVAIENARLYYQVQQVEATLGSVVRSLPQPFLLLSYDGGVLIDNEAAHSLAGRYMTALFDYLGNHMGQTGELRLGDKTYLTTIEQVQDTGVIAVMQDISRLKQLEDTRLEFVHALAHDLKSPISSIQGFAQLMRLSEPMSEKMTGYLLKIESGTKAILTLVEQLLDVALLEQAPRRNFAPLMIDDVVRRVVSDTAGAAEAREMKQVIKVEGVAYPISGDEKRLYRALLNLVDNAIKYSAANTEVVITTTFETDGLRISILDNGKGIAEDDLPHLFERYYRSKRVEHKVGYGLGLVLVDATARLHGGSVRAQNVEGHGAEFIIEIPRDSGLGTSPLSPSAIL